MHIADKPWIFNRGQAIASFKEVHYEAAVDSTFTALKSVVIVCYTHAQMRMERIHIRK